MKTRRNFVKGLLGLVGGTMGIIIPQKASGGTKKSEYSGYGVRERNAFDAGMRAAI